MNNIKDYRENELKNYAIGNAIIILLSSGLLSKIVSGTSGNVLAMAEEIITSAAVSAIFYIYVLLADSVIPGSVKDRIRFPEGLPGTHIFTDMKEGKGDIRFTTEQILEKYADIYKRLESRDGQDRKADRKYQNSAWMKIYRTYENVDRIFISNRDSLMCRDMCALTIWMLIAYVGICFLGFIAFDWRMIVFIVVELILSWLAARNKGTRLAYNVISEDLYNVHNN